MAEDRAVQILDALANVADGVERLQIGILGEELHDPVGEVHQLLGADDRLAGGALDVVLVVRDVVVVEPEGERPQAVLGGQVLGDPGAGNTDRPGEAADQRREETLAGLGGDALDDFLPG